MSALNRYTPFNNQLASIGSVSTQMRNLSAEEKRAATPAERKRIQSELERLMQLASAAAQAARKELDESGREDEQYISAHGSDATSSQIRNNLHTKAARDFTRTMREYHAALATFQSELRRRSVRDVRLVDPSMTENRVDALVDSGEASQFVQSRLLSPGLVDLEQTVDALEQRHIEIRRLEREVRLIADLFKDMATLVDLQQESLDVIEKHISETKKKTEEGEVEVQQAEGWMSKSRKVSRGEAHTCIASRTEYLHTLSSCPSLIDTRVDCP
jgi:t-SNARE complex subunit (syntaxin)